MNILVIVYDGQKEDALFTVKAVFPTSQIYLLTKADLKGMPRKQMLRLFRRQKRDLTVIFCGDLNTTEQVLLPRAFGMITKAKKRMMIDSKGRARDITLWPMLLFDFPLFVASWGFIFLTVNLLNLILVSLNLLFKTTRKGAITNRKSKGNLRIAYLRTDYEAGRPGGALSHVSGFANAMIKLNNEILFVSSAMIYGVDEKARCLVVEPVSLFNKICVEFSQIVYNLKFIRESYKAIRKYNSDFLYHRNATYNCSGTILSLLTRKPLFLEFNSSALWKTDKTVKQRFRMTRYLMERLNLAWADRIMVVSEVSRSQLKYRGIKRKKIVVNPNGADPQTFNPAVSSKDLRRIFGLDNKLLVGFAGSLYQWHGLETLVGCIKNVITKNTGVHFVIIGDGDLRNKLEKMAEEDGTSNFISFTGLVPKKEMPGYLNACDILASPHTNMADGRTFFGSPVKIFEYMAMAKPIVASNVGQLGEILQHEKNALLVPPDDPEELANAILRLAADPELREALGKRARNDLIQNYTWKTNARRVIHSYKEIS